MDEADHIEVEVGELSEWTTGFSDEAQSVALILRTGDGAQFGVTMPPGEALAMAEQLRQMGLAAIPVANA